MVIPGAVTMTPGAGTTIPGGVTVTPGAVTTISGGVMTFPGATLTRLLRSIRNFTGKMVSKTAAGADELDFAGAEAARGSEAKDGEETIEDQDGEEEEPGGVGKAVGL